MVNRKSSKNKSRKNKKTMKKMYSKMNKKEKKRLLRTIKKIKIFHKKGKSKKNKKTSKKVKKVMKGGSVPFDEVWRLPTSLNFAGSTALSSVSNPPAGAPDNVDEPVNPLPTSNPHVSTDDSNVVGGADLGKILTEYNA